MPVAFRVEINLGTTRRTLETLKSLKGFRFGMHRAGFYLINILKDEPPYQYVSRKSAYGSVFFSDVQQKAFFAKLDSGQISSPYVRTGGLQKGWYVHEDRDVISIGNHRRYSKVVVSIARQARLLAKIGWQTVEAVMLREKPAIQKIIRDDVLESLR